MIERYGAEAVSYAALEAINDLLCGDRDGCSTWERVVEATEQLLDSPTSRSAEIIPFPRRAPRERH